MWAYFNAGITFRAAFPVPDHFAVNIFQCMCWARIHAYAAVNALIYRIWIMAIQAVEAASLQKNYRPMTGAIHKT